MATIRHVDTIIVPISTILDLQVTKFQILAEVEHQSPPCTALQLQLLHLHIFTLMEIEEAGPLGRSHAAIIVIRIRHLARMVQTVDGQGQSESLSVDTSLASQ